MRIHHKSMLTDHDNIHLVTCLVLWHIALCVIFTFCIVMLKCFHRQRVIKASISVGHYLPLRHMNSFYFQLWLNIPNSKPPSSYGITYELWRGYFICKIYLKYVAPLLIHFIITNVNLNMFNTFANHEISLHFEIPLSMLHGGYILSFDKWNVHNTSPSSCFRLFNELASGNKGKFVPAMRTTPS